MKIVGLIYSKRRTHAQSRLFIVAVVKLDGMTAGINQTPTIRSTLLLVLFCTEILSTSGCQVIEGLFTVRTGSTRLVKEVIGTETVVLEGDFGGVNAGKRDLLLAVVVDRSGWGQSCLLDSLGSTLRRRFGG